MKFSNIAGILFIVTLITWGCNESESGEQEGDVIEQAPIEQAPKKEQVQLNEQLDAPSGEADKYGRMPGEEHYGHDHAPRDQQQDDQTNAQQGIQTSTQQDDQTNAEQETPSGEPDKFGRLPGEEHYGHDHE